MYADKDEQLDIINEKDQVIGKISKSEAHEKGVLHREIAVILFSGNSVLLQQRSYSKMYFPGKWSLTATGHVPSGMEPIDAAKMELKEELGIKCDLEFVSKKKYLTGKHQSIGYLYFGKISNTTKIEINKEELENAKFVDLVEYNKMLENDEIESHSVKDLQKYWAEPLLNS